MKKYIIKIVMLLIVGPSLWAMADFEVLVNESVKDAAISKDELKQVLLTNKLTWGDGKKVTIVVLSPDADQADAVNNEAMGMTALQAKKYYLTKVFNGVLASAPAAGDSSDDVAEVVAKAPGGIAVVAKGTKPGKAKLLPIK